MAKRSIRQPHNLASSDYTMHNPQNIDDSDNGDGGGSICGDGGDDSDSDSGGCGDDDGGCGGGVDDNDRGGCGGGDDNDSDGGDDDDDDGDCKFIRQIQSPLESCHQAKQFWPLIFNNEDKSLERENNQMKNGNNQTKRETIKARLVKLNTCGRGAAQG